MNAGVFIGLLALAALVAALALRRRPGIRREEERAELTLLSELLPTLNQGSSLRDVLDGITRGFSACAGGAPSLLRLYDAQSRLFVARAFAGVETADVETLSNQDVTQGQLEAVRAASSRAERCLRLESEPEFPDHALRRGAPPGLLVVPLEGRGVDPLGYLAVAPVTEDLARWADRKARLLGALSAYAVVAIDRAVLSGELDGRALALSTASRKLKELERLKDNFLSTVSHELRTPLTSVKAYAETLLRSSSRMDEPTTREFAQVIVKESDRLNELFDNILSVAQLETERFRMGSQDFSVLELCKEVFERIEPKFRQKEIRLTLVAPQADVMLHGDRSAIRQVIHNLLDNAHKFTEAGGGVRLLVDRDRQLVRLVVEDSGIGIPREEVDRVFDRFYQVDNSSTRAYGGPGLGLAVCRDLVDWHCGRIWSEPHDEQGTRFVVLLPRHGLVVRPHPHDSDYPHERTQREVFYQLATSLVAETMRTWIVSIMLVDESQEGLQIEAALGLPVDVVRDVHLRKSEGVAGVVWSEERSIHVPDLDADERFRGLLNEVRYPTRSLLSCPIRWNGEILGVLNVNNKVDETPFDESDRLLLEAMAERLAHTLREFRAFLVSHQTFARTKAALRAMVDVRRLQVTPLREEIVRCGLETARRLELAEPDLRTLAFALSHYDVGLAQVGSAILRKSQRLTLEERASVQEHVQHGVKLVARLGDAGSILKILMHHHENADGSGYPHGLQGEAIPLGARIVRLVDTLAALLHGDVRRDAMNLDAALATLRAGVGREFCSRVTPLFIEAVVDRSERLRAAASADPATGQIQLVAPATTPKLEPVGAGVGEE